MTGNLISISPQYVGWIDTVSLSLSLSITVTQTLTDSTERVVCCCPQRVCHRANFNESYENFEKSKYDGQDVKVRELTTIKNWAILRQGFLEGEYQLRPQRRIKAKWASLVGMLMKWDRLREPIARVVHRFPPSVVDKIPSIEEKVSLEEITRTLKDFESVAKGLQGGDGNRVSRYAARRAFDDLLDVHDSIERPLYHLRRDATIVNNKHIENAICKIQGQAEADLTNLEKAAGQMFKLPIAPCAVSG